MRHEARSAFTLVELLVVIAIISILAAMLLPALEEARTAALMTACRNGLRQGGIALISYAGDHRGAWPYRTVNQQSSYCGIHNLTSAGSGADDRPVLRDYLEIDELLVCPLCPLPSDISLDESDAAGVNSGYGLWFGGELTQGVDATANLRMGDRPAYGGSTFDILLADLERECTISGWAAMNSHPDDDGLAVVEKRDDTRCYVVRRAPDEQARLSAVDRSFLHDDGSVSTLLDLTTHGDGETVKVPANANSAASSYWEWLPPTE